MHDRVDTMWKQSPRLDTYVTSPRATIVSYYDDDDDEDASTNPLGNCAAGGPRSKSDVLPLHQRAKSNGFLRICCFLLLLPGMAARMRGPPAAQTLIDADPVIKTEPPRKRARSVSATAVPRQIPAVTLDLAGDSGSSSDDEDTKLSTMDRVVDQLFGAPLANRSPPRLKRRSKHMSRINTAPKASQTQCLAAAKDELQELANRAVENLSMLCYITGRIQPDNPRGDVLGLTAANGLRLLATMRHKVIKDARLLHSTTHRLAKAYRDRYTLCSGRTSHACRHPREQE